MMQIQLEQENTASFSRSVLLLVQINFDGEIDVISLALKELLCRLKTFEKVVILVGSRAAIQAVSSNSQTKPKKINDIKQALKHLQAFKKVVIFQRGFWIRSKRDSRQISQKGY